MFCIYISYYANTFQYFFHIFIHIRVVLAVIGDIVAKPYHKGNGCGSSRKILLLVEMERIE